MLFTITKVFKKGREASASTERRLLNETSKVVMFWHELRLAGIEVRPGGECKRIRG